MAYTTIDDPSKYFQTALYTGNDTNRTITNDGNSDLQPDFLWAKSRTHAEDNNLVNTLIGVNKYQVSNTNAAEASDTDRCTGVTSDGFSVGTDHRWNRGSGNMVVWQWLCTGGTRTATASEVDNANNEYDLHANQDAGFSMNAYVGTGANSTVPHGLGAAPDLVITKQRSQGSRGFTTWSNALAGNQAIDLDATSAAYTSTTSWNSTVPSSSAVSLGTRIGTNEDGRNFIMYCFRSIKGYSKIGKYVGNGNANGAFVHLGFKPAWLLVKSTSLAQSWQLSDSARNSSNVVNRRLSPNSASAESTAHSWVDFTSNGFKLRINDPAYNSSGASYLYYAIAEHPFVSSNGVPTTAR